MISSCIFTYPDKTTLTIATPTYAGRKNISFYGERVLDTVHPSISSVFENAINGRAQMDMKEVAGQCRYEEVAGDCGNKRGSLTECRCKVLDRVNYPIRRFEYENQVIDKILDIIKEKREHPFHFRLAIFASGRLLGKEILLFRLFNKLKGRKGTIEVFLIDLCYERAIAISNPSTKTLVGSSGTDYIAQFLEEICCCLPPSITIQGNFFAGHESYIKAARENLKFWHDLLIGADIEDTSKIMGEIRQVGLHPDIKPIVLVKGKDIPLVCKVDQNGGLQGCSIPGNEEAPATYPSASCRTSNGTSSGIDGELILGICAVVFSILAIVVIGAKK